jgi:hypothetical protein
LAQIGKHGACWGVWEALLPLVGLGNGLLPEIIVRIQADGRITALIHP